MTGKELKRLRRKDLLEIMLDQEKDIDFLQKRVEELEGQLNDRKINMTKAGSIAEASLIMNGMFEAAEASCVQYIENIQRLDKEQEAINKSREDKSRAQAGKLLRETKEKCAALEAETKKKCENLLAETDIKVEARWTQISQRLTAFYQSHQGLMELVNQGISFSVEEGKQDGGKEESAT